MAGRSGDLGDLGDLADDGLAERVARCGALTFQLLHGRGTPADLQTALADIDRLPDDLPARGALAGGLIAAMLRSSTTDPRALRPLDRLLEIADRHPPDWPEWPRMRAQARMMAMLRAGAEGGAADPRAIGAELDAIATSLADRPQHQAMLRGLRPYLTFLQAVTEGDHTALNQAQADMQRFREVFDGSPMAPLAEVLASVSDVMSANQRGDHDRVEAGLARIREYAEHLSPDQQHQRDSVADILMVFDTLRPAVTGQDRLDPRVVEAQLEAMRGRLDQPGATDADRARYGAVAGIARLVSGEETDLRQIDAALDDLRQGAAATDLDPQQQQMLLGLLGLGLVRRTEATGDVVHLAEAEQVLVRARDLAGGPDSANWSVVNDTLSYVRRRRGEAPAARRVALAGLRRHAWSVLLQSSVAAATEAARDAAGQALDVAKWCLADGAPGDAVRALDAGRGLVLYAATGFRDVLSRLEDAGRPDLADRWRAATGSGDPGSGSPGTAPVDLRREVLTVLSGGAVPGGTEPEDSEPDGLLDPPSLEEIRAALARLDADALVYLVPGDFPHPGYAVIVPVDGPSAYLPLTHLAVDDDVDVERYLSAVSQRDAALAEPGTHPAGTGSARDADAQATEAQFLDRLDTMCDWAWRAAIGPILERYLANRPPPRSGRPPRVILVPIGNLARIPWQAARRGDGTYAIELAAFSQAASARMLCDSATRAPVPMPPVGLVVGDPDTAGNAADLLAARLEAYAIQQAFYRGARYLGRRPDGSPSRSGAGTDREIREWLAATRPGAGAMLHLALHSVVQADPDAATSYLLLAGGERLTAEDLLATLAGSPDRAIALVVLAACRTGVSDRGYDEAYSIGTALLAGGVRSVLSTQWRIPDRDTSVLMYMFHHYLMVEHRPVWEALRRAQLWLLNPERKAPERMPAVLRQQLAATGPARVAAWAGFVHWGQ